MKVDLFDFHLPESNIALRPCVPREAARLLRVAPPDIIADYHVRDLPSLLQPGDALVFNDTKVIPARLEGKRYRPAAGKKNAPRQDGNAAEQKAAARAGGSDTEEGQNVSVAHIGATLHMRTGADSWRAFVKSARRVEAGEDIIFSRAAASADSAGGGNAEKTAASAEGAETGEILTARVEEKGEGGEVLLRFDKSGAELDAAIMRLGHMPLPPYIAGRRAEDAQDKTDYQTIYARAEGAVAAPTAGLHFTPALLAALRARGVEQHFITLHVGAGTFLPVKADDTEQHKMHFEIGEIDAETARKLREVKARGGKIIAVGTTALRLLETAAADGALRAWRGATDIFITPSYRFRFVDRLMTNFHLPQSTLFMLVSAFSGLELMQKAYAHAIEKNYRFYSYGDACLLDLAEPVQADAGADAHSAE